MNRPLASISTAKSFGISLLTLLFAFAFSTSALAQKPRQASALEITDDETPEVYSYSDGKRIEPRTGTIRSWSGVNQRFSGSPQSIAEQFLKSNQKSLNLRDANLADLQYKQTVQTLSGHTVRFTQHVNGVPVKGASLAVSMDQTGKVTFLSSDYKGDINVGNLSPAISKEDAGSSALARLNPTGPVNYNETELVIYYNKGNSRLAYASNQELSTGDTGEWETITDASTGQIISQKNISFNHNRSDGDKKKKKRALKMRVDGTGNVFTPDPLSSAGATYGDTGFTDGGDANTPQMIAEQMAVTLPDIGFDGVNYSFDGTRAKEVDLEGPFNGIVSQVTSDFSADRADDLFEVANVYFHVDHTMNYLNNVLGLNILPTLNGGVVIFDPAGLNGADNSHYNSGSELIAFGEGGVDDAEDADVVIHELGHGLHDWATGGLSQSNGLSEGIGDWVAASYSISLNQWTPAQTPYNWTFSWDGHNEFWGGRVTNWNDSNTWPAGTGGGCLHTCGQYWASSIVDIMEATSRDIAESLHWEGIKMTGASTTHEEAAAAVVQAAVNAGGANTAAVCAAFEYTGYWNTPGAEPAACMATLQLDMTVLTDPIQAGENVIYEFTATNSTGGTLTGVEVTNVLPSQSLQKIASTYVGDTCGGGESGGTWTWPVGSLADAAVAICQLTIDLASTPFTTIDFEDNQDGGNVNWTAGGTGNAWTLGAGGTGPDGGTQPPSTSSGADRWFAPDIATVGDVTLDLNTAIDSQSLTFWHAFDIESGWDGGVVEVSTNNGSSWADIVAAGGVFLNNAYNGNIQGGFGGPIDGRDAYTGSSSGWIQSIVDLSSVSLQAVPLQVRFRMGTDSSVDQNGWWVDDVLLGNVVSLCNTANATSNQGSNANAVMDPCPVVIAPPNLPVELTSFEGSYDGVSVQLNWTTASELNNAGFAIELKEGNAFSEIGFVQGNGTTAENANYQYIHRNAGVGRLVYRLRQVDFDGTTAYSQPIEILTMNPEGFLLSDNYPNPFNPRTNFHLTLGREQQINISVYDLQGKRVQIIQDGILSAFDRHNFNFSGSGLASGIYILKVLGESFQQSRNVMLSK